MSRGSNIKEGDVLRAIKSVRGLEKDKCYSVESIIKNKINLDNGESWKMNMVQDYFILVNNNAKQ